MSWRPAVLTFAGLLLATAAALWLFERQISAAWFRLGLQPELLTTLERSLDDQKHLARLDPERQAEYRQRFERTRELLQHLQILEHTRREILQRYEMVLLALPKLPFDLREILVLNVYCDYSAEQIAVMLGLAPNAVRTRACRARARLKKMIERMIDYERRQEGLNETETAG